ncbi:MAG: asparaginase [Lachnospiraceae bacterium]|nr:asparaginase [Lachnospiraceae bacterium]
MKKVLLLATGGTIACKVTEDGLAPLLSGDELMSYIPRAREFCTVDTVQIMNIDSTNMHPENWLKIAEAVEKYYDAYDGFVVAHGTDTMAYTAAALSYLIQNSPKPIILTGSQKPISMDMTDAKQNLMDSLRYACFSRAHGVTIVFGGKVISGTRGRKMNTKSFDAFGSINYPVLAVIHDSGIIQYLDLPMELTGPVFYHRMDPRVFILKLIPGIDPFVLRLVSNAYDAFVLESYGVGGIPEGEHYTFREEISNLISWGKTVVLTTQAVFEGSDITVYHSGHTAKAEFGLMESYDMTLEATVAKLMWILGQTREPEKIKELFNTPIAGDILVQEE